MKSEQKRKILLAFFSCAGIVIPIVLLFGVPGRLPLALCFLCFAAGVAFSVCAIKFSFPVLKSDKETGTETPYAQLALIMGGASFGAHLVVLFMLLLRLRLYFLPF